MINYKKVGEAIRIARESKGLTIWKIATMIDEQYNTVKRIEDGNPFLTHHCLWIKEILGVDALQILNGEGSHVKSKEQDKKQSKKSAEVKVEIDDII